MADSKILTKHKAEAKAAGLTLIGTRKNHRYHTYRFNECGHEQEIRADQVRQGEFRCRECLNEKLATEAATAGLTLIGPGKNNTYRTYRFDECGHEEGLQIGHVRTGGFTCQQRFREKLEAEAATAGLTLMGPGKNKDYRTYRFNECGHEQQISTGNVRIYSFICNTCEETTRDLPSSVCLLKIGINSFEWLKLGYAKKVDERVKQYGLASDAKVTTIIVQPFDTGREAHRFEASIHAKYANRGLPPEQMRKFHTKTGFDECYPVDMQSTLTRELRKLEKAKT